MIRVVVGAVTLSVLFWPVHSSAEPGKGNRAHNKSLFSTTLFQIEPGIGSLHASFTSIGLDHLRNPISTSSFDDSETLLGLGFRLRVPMADQGISRGWSLLWRLRFAVESSAPTSFEGVLVPLLMGSELALAPKNGRGRILSPYVLLDYGPTLPISGDGFSDLKLGYQLGGGVDIFPHLGQGLHFSLSYVHMRWNDDEWSSLYQSGRVQVSRSESSQSQLKMALAFPF
jgi:hypothetical protein